MRIINFLFAASISLALALASCTTSLPELPPPSSDSQGEPTQSSSSDEEALSSSDIETQSSSSIEAQSSSDVEMLSSSSVEAQSSSGVETLSSSSIEVPSSSSIATPSSSSLHADEVYCLLKTECRILSEAACNLLGTPVPTCDDVTINPSLTGTCAWSKNSTTSAKGATPAGILLNDPDNICGATNPPVVYKYDGGSKTWPTTGLVPAGIYNDVQATVNCPAYDIAPIMCPALTVIAGSEHSIGTDAPIEVMGSGLSVGGIGQDECINITINWDNQHYQPPVRIRCDGQFWPSGVLTIIKDGAKCSEDTGSAYISTECLLGYLEYGKLHEWTVCINYVFAGDGVNINCMLMPS